MIVGASDRMLTAGDIEFEPPKPKIAQLNSFVVALTAGDSAAHAAITSETQQALLQNSIFDVGRVAKIYANRFAAYRRGEAESAILAPLGLTTEEFLRRQHGMAPDLVSRLTSDLQRYRGLEDTSAIIAGLDVRGAHLYVVSDPGFAVCNDGIGFAAIGIGQNHAESQFMFAKYTPSEKFEKALFLTYYAKKRAEVAPGVGNFTDMFYIGFSPPQFSLFHEKIVNDLDDIYVETRNQEVGIGSSAHARVEEYIKTLAAKAKEGGGQASPTGDGVS
jgi:hypothetical protein